MEGVKGNAGGHTGSDETLSRWFLTGDEKG